MYCRYACLISRNTTFCHVCIYLLSIFPIKYLVHHSEVYRHSSTLYLYVIVYHKISYICFHVIKYKRLFPFTSQTDRNKLKLITNITY